MTVRSLIEREFASLSASEKRIARLISERYPVSALGGIEDIAKQCDVSAPTVTRFVKRLGFARFADFQRAIRIEVQDNEVSPLALLTKHQARTSSDDARDDAVLLDDLSRSIASLSAPIALAGFEQGAKLIAENTSRIFLIGGRWSSIAAQYLAYQLSSLRGEVHVLAPAASGVMPDRIADFSRRDLLIAYDFRRYQDETIAFCRTARMRGVRILLFTDPELSPISDFAEISLPVPVATTTPMDTLTPTLAASDALLAHLVKLLGPRASKRMVLLEELRRAAQDAFRTP
jgi:DNA-binding MurR/RpiR family transcriptional regulator